MVILFWFHKAPDIVADRLRGIRRINPGVPVFGLYGGLHAGLQSFSTTASLLDDLWVHPEVEPGWAWLNGDLMLARWYQDRGSRLGWSSLFVHQWDLLAIRPASDFATSGPGEILLTGVRPLEEVTDRWVWVQPWSHHRSAFDAFRNHPRVRGEPLLSSLFILATFSRQFLAEYALAAPDVPGFLEYRLPTLARTLGYRFAPCDLRPDWGDCGDPLLNGCQRAVTSEQIQQRCGECNRGVWHPVCQMVPWDDLLSNPPRSADADAGERIGILQVPPTRPGLATGGAQVVALALARGLRQEGFRPVLFAGAAEDTPTSWVSDGVECRSAFRLTPAVLRDGQPHVEWFPGEDQVLRQCRAAFMLDRVFRTPEGVDPILVLGATAYPFARAATLSSYWRRMIVPSPHVARQVEEWLRCAGQGHRFDKVKIIPNPVDPESLGLPGHAPVRGTGRRARLLFPHRADPGKGLETSLRLLAAMSTSHDATLLVVVDASPTADGGFYRALSEDARILGVEDRVEMVPWRPRGHMADLYRSADLTLCLGEVPEGFGLGCVESVLCGTPVLARDVGAQAHLLPPNHGCFVAPAEEDELVRLAHDILSLPTLPEQLQRGATFIRNAYSPEAFIASVLAATGLSPRGKRRSAEL